MLGPNSPSVIKLDRETLQREWVIKKLLRKKYPDFDDRDIDYLYFVLDDSEHKEKFTEMFLGLLKRKTIPDFSIIKENFCRFTSYNFIYDSVSYMYIKDDDYNGQLTFNYCPRLDWITEHDSKYNSRHLKHKLIFETGIPTGENYYLPAHRLERAYLRLRFPDIDSDYISMLYSLHIRHDLVLSLLLGLYDRLWGDNTINTYPFNNTYQGEPDYDHNIHDYFKCIFFNPLSKKARFKAYRNIVNGNHQYSEYYECDINVFMKEIENYDKIRFKDE